MRMAKASLGTGIGLGHEDAVRSIGISEGGPIEEDGRGILVAAEVEGSGGRVLS